MIFQANITLIFVLIFSIAFPIGLMIWWKRKTGEKLLPFLVGAVVFVVFAMGLEGLLHQFCLVRDNPVSRAILASPVLFTLYAAFAAGIFEETGCLFAYKVLLRKYQNNTCAVAYGIGHGGIEVLLVLGVSYLMLLLAQLGIDFGGAEVNQQLITSANGISFATAGVAILERVFAMMIHIGLSMMVFVAAREKGQLWLYPAAILLHALVDVPAALYQYQVMISLFAVEAAAFGMGVLCLVFGSRVLRKREKRLSIEPENQWEGSR